MLDSLPPSKFTEWQAAYMLRPWDAADTYAMLKGDFKREQWLEDLIDEQLEKDKKTVRKKTYLTGRAMKRAMQKLGTFLGWTWP